MATWPRAMPVVDRRPSGGAVPMSSGNQNVAPGGTRARRLAAAAAAARQARGRRCSQGAGRGTSHLLLAVAAPRLEAAAKPGLAGLVAAAEEAGGAGPSHALGPPSVIGRP